MQHFSNVNYDSNVKYKNSRFRVQFLRISDTEIMPLWPSQCQFYVVAWFSVRKLDTWNRPKVKPIEFWISCWGAHLVPMLYSKQKYCRHFSQSNAFPMSEKLYGMKFLFLHIIFNYSTHVCRHYRFGIIQSELHNQMYKESATISETFNHVDEHFRRYRSH